jgi:hypothetical protein
MNNQSLGYDPKDAISIWQYSAGLLGHTLREFVDEENLKEYSEEDLLLGIAEHNRWNMEQLLFGYLPCDKELDKIFEQINKEGMNDSVKEEYELWKQKNGINKTDYKKIKDDVKGLEYRIHPNICEFLHLDNVDKDAKGYDSMLNNAIAKILDLVRN